MISLHGQQVLVVGGSSGIGLATAKAAVAAGAHVTIAGRSEAKLELAVQALGHGVVGRPLDAGDDKSVADFFADGKTWDHVVATTGAGGRGQIANIAMADALAAMNGKFWTYFRVARAAKIATGGSLTLVSGGLGSKPAPGAALVSAINAAIEGLTRGLALDFAPTRVNTVSPGHHRHAVVGPHVGGRSAGDVCQSDRDPAGAADRPCGRRRPGDPVPDDQSVRHRVGAASRRRLHAAVAHRNAFEPRKP